MAADYNGTTGYFTTLGWAILFDFAEFSLFISVLCLLFAWFVKRKKKKKKRKKEKKKKKKEKRKKKKKKEK